MKGSSVISLFVVVIILLIIIPIPSYVLDMLFIINIAVSFVILLMTMNIKEALEFSIFPSLLLVTTLFRLGLNVRSTTLILLDNGYAGEVVQTFGDFVIRGNAVVGIIIFFIIVLVQFIVITKGSERVAEVAARFTLDAMPGKQMAIDADLSSGLIDEADARKRRTNIQREADFFGSMDGASKFVKGDAILSILVTLINLIGGVIIGFINGVGDFTTIMNIYSTATVGDGLVSQIPALLISVSTGMMVTRSASENNINDDFSRQFLSQPRVLILAGITVAALMLIPGFPKVQLIIMSSILIGLGVVLTRTGGLKALAEGEQQPGEPTQEITSEAQYYKNIENVYGLLTVEPIEMEFGYSLIPLVVESMGGTFVDRVVMFRKQFATDMGIVVPSVYLKDSGHINPNQYLIKLKGEQVAQGDVLIDHLLALAPPEDTPAIDGIDTVDPAFGLPAKWISNDKKVKAEVSGYTLIDPTSVMVTHLSEVIKQHAHELLTRQEVNNILTNLKKTNENLVNDLIPGVVSLNDLQKVLGNLLQEGVPIRDIETILETLSDYALTIKDTDMLTEYVRQSLKRTISRRFAEGGQLKVISIDNSIEQTIMAAVKKVDQQSYLALDPDVIQSIINASTKEINKVKDIVQQPVVITSPVVRIYYKKLIDQFFPGVTVLSFNEIDQTLQIQALANITLS